jgi:cytochrome c oxidase cbb3-type subunit 2
LGRLITSYSAAKQSRDFDGQPSRLTEMDALVAYLQQLGTHVDFRKVEPHEVQR